MITYKWRVVKLDTYPLVNNLTNVVYAVHWECNAEEQTSDRTYVARAADNTYVTVKLDNFTEYQNLTEAQVLGWVFQTINKEHMEARIAEVLASEKRPLVVTLPLPWK